MFTPPKSAASLLDDSVSGIHGGSPIRSYRQNTKRSQLVFRTLFSEDGDQETRFGPPDRVGAGELRSPPAL
jgi:hypothetical protein